MKRLLAIDAARGIAAILVMLYHCNAVVQAPKYFGKSPFGGFFGLDGARMPIFFALSGFLMVIVHERDLGQPRRLRRFLIGRITRVYPLYWFMLLILLPAYAVRPELGGGNADVDAWTWTRYVFLIPKAGWPEMGFPLLTVAWTLQSMLLFYLVFALGVWRKLPGLLIFGLWQACVVAGEILSLNHGFPTRFLLSPLYVGFLTGGLAAWAFHRDWIRWPKVWFTMGTGILLGFQTLNGFERYPLGYDWQLMVNCGAAAVALAGLAQWERGDSLQAPRLLVTWGEASYAIFLFHYPLLSVLAKAAKAFAIERWLSVEVLFVLFAIVCIFSGLMFHRLVEKPMMRWIRGWVEAATSPRKNQEPPSSMAA